jgi:hypothetical protein
VWRLCTLSPNQSFACVLSSVSTSMENNCIPYERLSDNDPRLLSVGVRWGCENFPSSSIKWIELGDSIRRNTHLRALEVSFNPLIDEDLQIGALGALAQGLSCNDSLKSLTFRNAVFWRRERFSLMMGRFWCGNPNIETLQLDNCIVENSAEWTVLGKGLNGCTSMKNVTIDSMDLSSSLYILAASLRGDLAKLRLRDCAIDSAHIQALASSWRIDQSTPSFIDLSGNVGIGVAGCKSLGLLLRLSYHKTRRLSLNHAPVGSRGVCALLRPYKEQSLKRITWLDLKSTGTSDEACFALADLLREPGNSLLRLNLKENQIGDAGVSALVEGLRSNNKLRLLSLDGNVAITEKGWSLFQHLLGDLSSIDATHNSNHTLASLSGPSRTFFGSTSVGCALTSLLEINHLSRHRLSRHSARTAAVRKIVKFHLGCFYSNTGRPSALPRMIPSILGWIGDRCCTRRGGRVIVETCDSLSAFYHIIRNNASLFAFEIRHNARKRKRTTEITPNELIRRPFTCAVEDLQT